MKKLVLIGNGMAGIRTLEEIIKRDPSMYEITIFGKEPYPNYNRILLSKVLQGDSSVEDIVLNDYDWYEKHGITLRKGEEAVEVDTEQQIVYGNKGEAVKYDTLLFATGSNPFMLPIDGADKEGVIAFRDIQDCETMIESSKKYKKAAVIGGGLLGLEAARGLLNLDMEVDVVHLPNFLMERQLDEPAAKMLRQELESQGMNFLMEKQTVKLRGKDRVTGLLFKDGSSIEADLVVMAIGIRPNVQLAKEAGLEVDRAIVVDDYMRTSAPNVYAVGECVQHRDTVYGLVAPLYEQGKILAEYLTGDKKSLGKGYEGTLLYTQLKVSGVDVFSAGEFVDKPDTKAIRVHDEFEGIYKKVVVRDNKVIGSVLFGDTKDSPRLLDMMKKGQDISEMNKVAILPSEDHSAGAESPVVAMDASETICGCNGVCKGDVVTAIKEKELSSVGEVTAHTNAGRSCGGCKPLVSDLLEHTLGEAFSEADKKQPMCGCTDYSHEEVLEEIRSKKLTLVKEVMNVLEWKEPEGCSGCRPAINYYIGMAHPTESDDDMNSKFINERVHANIQNDGTFSVVPRMYGGVTNPEELRKIADVADKYKVKMVKVTGGQRLDLLGVNKEDLPSIWEDLGMPSGHAYGKSVRTVKTCVGQDFCRFGTQDSIQLGIDIEKRFQGLQTPHKVKMGVSACPRNCAESGIKDIGLVGLQGAWEMYVAGNGGIDLRQGDLLCTLETDEEVMEMISAYMQYYRETARYLERTSHWLERLGLEHVKSVVVEDKEQRAALAERMDTAIAQFNEPWQQIINDGKIKQDYFEANVTS
ncbi:nitrite reductase large subunit NirB [Alkalicoccus daliensis]|uniref:Nitrite reductase (NADH) large subunit n=1 Tax=Alkalicoccus daliensis TaxID=745820 RepID=A0A1H0FX67_9BACI|nr:nitrite reductase large subunit NirB [Alkalicoccus daliensis]SDN99278.1 nitrite reductase (NADH) large subunit [Alkalicoccus daliensis]